MFTRNPLIQPAAPTNVTPPRVKTAPKTTTELANNYDHVKLIADDIRTRLNIKEEPSMLIVCGSGLSSLADGLTDVRKVSYSEIPGFPVGNVKGHTGALVYGKLAGKTVLCMQGRVHVYETNSPTISAMPIRIAALLGCRTLIMTSAVGGIDKALNQGDIVVTEDHISIPLMALRSPLIGDNDERFGPRFISTVNLYDKKLRELARQIGVEQGITIRDVVYAMVGGPHFETPAEVQFLRLAGASIVGMSVAHESVIARHMGMKTLSLSLVTNVSEDKSDAVESSTSVHDDVLEESRTAATRMCKLVVGIVEKL